MKSDGLDGSDGSDSHARLRASGGYRQLHSFQAATLIYDATVSFCDRFIDRRSRTHDQMVQAARIAERQRQNNPSDPPACPQCGKSMTLRMAHKGPNAGSRFWGCTGYPDCKGTRKINES